jgi:rRNA maturation protein Nop10
MPSRLTLKDPERRSRCLCERLRCGGVRSIAAPPLTEPADDHGEDRRQENAEQGHANHTGEDCRPQRATHLGPGPLRDHQREHAQDEGERRHNDRPQPHPGGFHGGLEQGGTLLLLVAGELDDEDGVLGRQAHQYHEANLHEDVDVHPGQRDACHGTQQAHGHDQDHRQRQRPTLVQARQHEEDQHHAKRFSYILLGICSWMHRWYRPGGEWTPEVIAEEVITLLESGYLPQERKSHPDVLLGEVRALRREVAQLRAAVGTPVGRAPARSSRHTGPR